MFVDKYIFYSPRELHRRRMSATWWVSCAGPDPLQGIYRYVFRFMDLNGARQQSIWQSDLLLDIPVSLSRAGLSIPFPSFPLPSLPFATLLPNPSRLPSLNVSIFRTALQGKYTRNQWPPCRSRAWQVGRHWECGRRELFYFLKNKK